MRMKSKYKVKLYFKDVLDSKYKVNIEGNLWGRKVTVRDFTDELHPEFRGKKVLKLFDDGNSISFKLNNQRIKLDYSQACDILVALLARSVHEGYTEHKVNGR